jgi:hypothetical protein
MITDANMCDINTYNKIEDIAKDLIHAKEQCGGSFPAHAEIVLELPPLDMHDVRCYYYCVHHDGRTLFWLDEKKVEGIVFRGLKDLPQLSKMFHLV